MCTKSVNEKKKTREKKKQNPKAKIAPAYLKETVTHQIVKCKLFLSTEYHMDAGSGLETQGIEAKAQSNQSSDRINKLLLSCEHIHRRRHIEIKKPIIINEWRVFFHLLSVQNAERCSPFFFYSFVCSSKILTALTANQCAFVRFIHTYKYLKPHNR